MDIIEKEDFENMEDIPIEEEPTEVPMISVKELEKLRAKFDQPTEEMKTLAAKLKFFLEYRMNKEFSEKGILSDFTRRWIKEYNDLLDRIQRALYGEKSVNLHLGKISHSHIAEMIRSYEDIPPSKESFIKLKPNGEYYEDEIEEEDEKGKDTEKRKKAKRKVLART